MNAHNKGYLKTIMPCDLGKTGFQVALVFQVAYRASFGLPENKPPCLSM
ncbi:hypothetical protein [Eikenella sp. Marseille-P7795]|nr:hypothetical protein [Eikenella sp. Marseille-P7795]